MYILLLIPVVVCGTLGGFVGYLCRHRLWLQLLLSVGIALAVFVLFQITSGVLSRKYSLQENLNEQLYLVAPFLLLYLLPAITASLIVGRLYR